MLLIMDGFSRDGNDPNVKKYTNLPGIKEFHKWPKREFLLFSEK